jgi:transcriptional regulator with XRE-family HTH domain
MNLVNLGRELIEDVPELHDTIFSFSAELGKLVFAARIDRKLTQNQLAKLANVSSKTIHRIEGGSGGVTDRTYEKVFKALKITGDDLAEALKKLR